MPGGPLGIARKAIDTVKAMAPGKLVVPEMQMMKDLRRVRSAVAHAEAALGAARAYVNEALERLGTGEPVGLDDRHALTLSRVHAFRAGRDITQAMVDTAGASAVYATSPLERLLRDASTLSQHIVAQERVYEQVGGVLLGEPQEFPLY